MGGSSTTRTEPWAEQKEYLKTGFGRAGELLKEGAAPYYGGATLAGFDPAQQAAQAGMLGYAGGPRPKAMQKAAENQLLGLYDVAKQAPEYAMGRGNVAQQYAQSGLEAIQPTMADLMSGDVNYAGADSPYKAMADVYGQQYMSEIAKNMPGVRQQMVEYQPGGGSRGDIAQANIASAAGKNLAQNLAGLYGGAYAGAQAQRLPAAQQAMAGYGAGTQAALSAGQLGMQGLQSASDISGQALGAYPSLMGAPLSMKQTQAEVGAQRRAMTQEALNQDMARYNYESMAPMNDLQQYMSNISGDYGGTTTQSPSALQSIGQMASIAAMFSDVRVKENIAPTGKTYKGHNLYDFNYIGNNNRYRGVMAQEVEQTRPDAVGEVSGIKYVNYGDL